MKTPSTQSQTPPRLPPTRKRAPQRKYRFGWTYDVQIKRPTPTHLLLAATALVIALCFPLIFPSIPWAIMALQAFALSGSFIAGAHRTSTIRYRIPIMLPILLAIPFIRYIPLAIPAAPLISYAYFTLGNAWKYWYLQQDPARHNPHYRYFKDPNTRPQQHIIYALFLTPPVFLIGGATLVGLEGLGLYSSTVGSILLALLMGGCLLFALIHLTLGIVQLIRRAVRKRSASSKARPL